MTPYEYFLYLTAQDDEPITESRYRDLVECFMLKFGLTKIKAQKTLTALMRNFYSEAI